MSDQQAIEQLRRASEGISLISKVLKASTDEEQSMAVAAYEVWVDDSLSWAKSTGADTSDLERSTAAYKQLLADYFGWQA